MKRTVATNMFLLRKGEILLGLKKRKFGKGKWNGVGGKVDPGETIDQTAVRETLEEILVKAIDYQKVGELVFTYFYTGKKEELEVHFYTCTKWDGEPAETEEMLPRWFKTDEIPFDKMFADDIYWMPLLLAGKKFRGYCDFDENWKIINHKIEEVAEL